MKYFPTLCVDDFYSNPDEIKKFALSLDYDSQFNSDPLYPGIRTVDLNFIDLEFFNKFSEKLLSLLFDLNFNNINFKIVTNFQKIYPYKLHSGEVINTTQIHKDCPCLLAGVIYFNKKTSLSAGTNIYDLKDKKDINIIYDKKYDALKDIFSFYDGKISKNFDIKNYKNLKKEYEDKFELSASIASKYNRMIIYDSDLYHSANSFDVEEEFRLTQVFFIHELSTSSSEPPILRKNKIYL